MDHLSEVDFRPEMTGRLRGGAESTDELTRLLRSVLTRWKVILLIVIAVVGAATVAVRKLPLNYVATAQILIDHSQNQYADLGDSSGARSTTVWPAELETYMKILWSDQLADDVVRTVGLTTFKKPIPPWAPIQAWVEANLLLPLTKLTGWPILQLQTGLLPLLAEPVPARTEADALLDEAVAVFRDQLVVSRDSLAATISIGYRGSNADLATRVANATAQAFLRELVRSQKVALSASADYLSDRVTALSGELETADAQAQALRQKLSDFGSGSLLERHYAELVSSLSEAEALLVDARNDVALAADRTQGLNGRFDTPALTNLRMQELQISRQLAELSADFQPRYPAVATARAEQAEIRNRIRAEESQIRAQLESGLQVKAARVDWIKNELRTVEQNLALEAGNKLRLQQLTTRTGSTRLLYQDLLTRYQRAREQQLMIRPAARIINDAHRPDLPEGRKQWLIIIGAAIASFATAVGLVLLLELRRQGYGSAEELRSDTNLPVIGSLPIVKRNSWSDLSWRTHRGVPQSIYAEAIRRSALRLLPAGRVSSGHAEIILVTSAVPGEGKTVVSLSLGRQLASNGLKVLVIDSDLRKRSLKNYLGYLSLPSTNLVSLLTTPAQTIEDALLTDQRFGMDFLLTQETPEDPARLFQSSRMTELLTDLGNRYDVILIDSAPALAVSDTMALVSLVDRILFVTRWQTTSRKLVNLALDEIRLHGGRPCELILNAVNLRTYPRYASCDQLAQFRLSSSYLR